MRHYYPPRILCSTLHSSTKEKKLQKATQDYLLSVTISDLLKFRGNRPLVSVGPNDVVDLALERMHHSNMKSVVVLCERAPVGIFTKSDILERVIARGLDAKKERVARHMTENVITASPQMPLRDVMGLLARNRIQQLPISSFIGNDIDQDARIVDVLNARDIFHFLVEVQ